MLCVTWGGGGRECIQFVSGNLRRELPVSAHNILCTTSVPGAKILLLAFRFLCHFAEASADYPALLEINKKRDFRKYLLSKSAIFTEHIH